MKATYSLEIKVEEIETDDPEKLSNVAETIEMVVRGILQECDLEAVSYYNGCKTKLTEVDE